MNALLLPVAAAAPWFIPLVAVVMGACVGSFLNVVILRVPKGQSIVRPGSHCGCGAPIAWHDNIPVLSWLVLRGRARCCGRPFSWRYPAIEALTAGLFVVAAVRLPPDAALCAWVLLASLVAATFIDLDHLIIPDALTVGLGVVGVALSVLVPALHGEHAGPELADRFRSGADALVGLVAGSGLVLWIALVAEVILRKEAMGFGDVKFVGAIGAFCGWHGAVFSIFGGAAVGTIWFAVALAVRAVTSGGAGAGREAPGTPGGAAAAALTAAAAAAGPGPGLEPGPVQATAAAGPVILPAQTPDGHAGAPAPGMHVPFGPMLAIAGALYLLFLRAPVDAWFADLDGIF